MRILEYADLDASGLEDQYERTRAAIARGDFRAAEVKKLEGHKGLYRAKLDRTDRLIFSLVKHRDEVGALMLEIIRNHDYGKSRFLRGAAIDESKLRELAPGEAAHEARCVRYLHPERTAIHFLDKPLSFDDAQEAVYRLPPPQIIVGGAGSGKTALALEKLKGITGEALYVTQSAFLARNARDLYYASGFEREDQNVEFLSYRELIESIRIPPGREVTWRDFEAWFARQRQAFRGIEGHQALEEIRGVLAACPSGVLSREEYRALGVRRSIFGEADRGRLYDLFERYRAHLVASSLFDAGLLAHEWRALAAPRYDFLVIDEAQDLTAAQLALVLKTLKHPGRFLLCGDSNQIVHPNFFSWSAVKSLFWSDPELAARQGLRVLATNFRNGLEATRLANTLLKVKHGRFGSVDRESNFLVQPVGEEAGKAVLLADTDAVRRELDATIRQSTQFAVLVLREEDKVAARQAFSTPLLFSVQEAKGLEYENIILFRFISNARREFTEIAAGVLPADLSGATLEYARARDKSDKSLEIYKFFVNALYVALTRAIRNLYVIESDLDHALFALLGLTAEERELKVEAQRSSLEDWQKEARKLELQGKQEQADAIRRSILRQHTPTPWPVFDEPRLREALNEVFRTRVPGEKRKARLYDWAAAHDEPMLASWLAQEANYGPAHGFSQQRAAVARKYLAPYSGGFFQEILRQCDAHGLEHRTLTNMTPLMAACAAGNVRLVDALLERGASPETTDHYGRNALHWAMLEAFREAKFARGAFVALYERVAPPFIDLKIGERLVRIDRHLSEYFLFQTVWALFKSRFTHSRRPLRAAFDTASILDAWKHLPQSVIRPQRNRREHISAVLSRNEVERDYAYNRALFKRITHGWYQINPRIAIRRSERGQESWQPVLAVLNLPLIKEFALEYFEPTVDRWLAEADMQPCAAEFARERTAASRQRGERAMALARGARERWYRERALLDEEELATPRHSEQADEMVDDELTPIPKWGTPEAREREMRRLQRRIDLLRRKAKEDDDQA
ncbi:MAG: UvrD-helicase domain-containing protein [Steroidobacteraceae bacterium]